MSEDKKDLVADQPKEMQDWELAMRAKQAAQEKMKASLKQGPSFISFRGGQLLVDKTPVPNGTLQVIVLTFAAENAFYKGRFDPDSPQNPKCWAVYKDITSMEPDPTCEEIQNSICEECPKFQWGSDPLGGRGKACKSRYRIAVIPNALTYEEVLAAEMRMGVLPVTSTKAFEKFMSACQMLFNRPIFGVVTEIKVTPDVKTQFKVELTPIAAIDPSLIPAIIARSDSADNAIMYGYRGADEEEAAVAPKKTLK